MTKTSTTLLAGLACSALSLLSPTALADPPLPAWIWHQCRPTESMIYFGSRYHVRCDSPMMVGLYRDIPIYYFAISDSNANQVQQAMSIVNTAIQSGKNISLYAATSSVTNPGGCLSSDCRYFGAVMVVSP